MVIDLVDYEFDALNHDLLYVLNHPKPPATISGWSSVHSVSSTLPVLLRATSQQRPCPTAIRGLMTRS